MKFTKNKYIKYKRAELERFVVNAKSCVKKINRTDAIPIAPQHFSSVKNYITCVFNAKIGKYEKNFDGIVLDFRNVKVINTNSVLRPEDPFVRITVIADFYVFRPYNGAVLRGIVKHSNKHSLGVILHRVFTVNIRLTDEKAYKTLQINQEVEFQVIGFDFDSKFACIDGDLLNTFEMPKTSPIGKVNRIKNDEEAINIERKPIVKSKSTPRLMPAESSSSSDEKSPTNKITNVSVKQEIAFEDNFDSTDSDDEPRISKKTVTKQKVKKEKPSTSTKVQPVERVPIKKEHVTSNSESSQSENQKNVKPKPAKPKLLVKKEVRQSSESSSDDEAANQPKIKTEPTSKKRADKEKIRKPIAIKPKVRHSSSSSESSDHEEIIKKPTNKIKPEPGQANGNAEINDDKMKLLLKINDQIEAKEANQRKRRRESASDSDDDQSPSAKRANMGSLDQFRLNSVRRKLLQSDSDSSEKQKSSMSSPKIKLEKSSTAGTNGKKKSKKHRKDNDDDFDQSLNDLFASFKNNKSTLANGATTSDSNGKKAKHKNSTKLSLSILKNTDSPKKSRKSVKFSRAD